jgi:hypothetical protein
MNRYDVGACSGGPQRKARDLTDESRDLLIIPVESAPTNYFCAVLG